MIMKKVWTSRSSIETYQRCNRARYLEYHFGGMGITSSKKPLPLAVGGAVHAGLEVLLRAMMDENLVIDFTNNNAKARMAGLEDVAVAAALAELAKFAGALEVDLAERQAMAEITKQAQEFRQQLAGSLHMTPEDAGLETLIAQVDRSQGQFDKYLYEEQAALVEGMVRAYARHRLRPLLEQFEVLEVEREGEWKLSEWGKYDVWRCERGHKVGLGGTYCGVCGNRNTNKTENGNHTELWFASRPDALLRERQSNELYILSFKTAASWDVRKARDAERDMQGLSEGIEVERRLGAWHAAVKNGSAFNLGQRDIPQNILTFLSGLNTPPRILGIRYEYLLKGDRRIDKDLTQELGIETRSQSSHLVRGYLNPGMSAGDETWNWSWDYHKEDGSASKLYWKSWRGTPVWRQMPVKEWIDKLDSATETFTDEGKLLGWSCPAQATGFTSEHPLDLVFVPPIVVYRNEDDLRDLVEQMEAQEVRVAEAVELVKAAKNEGEKRSLLNRHFPQTRKACEYPSSCQFVSICYGGDEMRLHPIESGKFKRREPNHKQELEGRS
jgi:hypothetical protein